jgi:hypothetical protein
MIQLDMWKLEKPHERLCSALLAEYALDDHPISPFKNGLLNLFAPIIQ